MQQARYDKAIRLAKREIRQEMAKQGIPIAHVAHRDNWLHKLAKQLVRWSNETGSYIHMQAQRRHKR